MGQTNKIIEINGKRYDAVSGAIVTDIRRVARPATTVHATHKLGRGSIDGFGPVNRDHMPRSGNTTIGLTPKPATKAAAKPVKHRPHTAASHAAHHQPQKAVTLMRTAVKKPDIKSASVIKSQTRTDLLAKKPIQTIVPKKSYYSVDKVRNQRAQRLIQSPAVSHFRKPQTVLPQISRPVIPAQAAAVATPAIATLHQPATSTGALDFIATSRPQQTHTAPHSRQHQTPLHQQVNAIKHTPTQLQSSDIFAQALAGATSHQETFEDTSAPKNRKRKNSFGLVGASLAVLLVIGIFGYQNAPQLSLKVASYRAGLDAKMPNYQPANYAFSNLDYKPGSVTVNYTSQSGDQQYKISQRPSNWDSQALLSNVVSSASNTYKTYQRAGRTVYVMANNTATWVDSGILYTVGGNANLSSSQLLDLASSM